MDSINDDDMKYFIYAFDIKKKEVTAALSCYGEKQAKRTCLKVSRIIETECGTKRFHFHYTHDVSQIDYGLDEQNVYINYTLPPMDGQKGNRRALKICKMDDFVFAESQTEEYLRTNKKRPLDIQFMYLVKLVLEGKPLPIEPETKKVVAKNERGIAAGGNAVVESVDRLTEHRVNVLPPKKTKDTIENLPDFDKEGIFVTQAEFEKRSGWSKRTLEEHRLQENVTWSKDGLIGETKARYFIKVVGHKNKPRYKYFVYYKEEKNRYNTAKRQ